MAGFDINQANKNHLGMVASGFLAFIFTFISFYGWSGGGFSVTWSAWHSWGVIGCLLVVVALIGSLAVAAAGMGMVQLPKLPMGLSLGVAAVSILALIILALRALTWPGYSVPGGSLGLRWGGYVLLILLFVQAVFAWLSAQSAGEKLEWDMPKSGSSDAGATPSA